MNSKALIIGALIGAILGAVVGPYVAAEFTTVYVFQAGEYRILGALIGALLGLLIFIGKRKKVFESKEGEKTILQVDATYNFEPGKMRITDQRIQFESSNSTMEIPFERILKVETAKNLGILSDAIIIQTTDRKKLKFSVANRDKIIEIMKDKVPHLQSVI